MTGFFIRYQDDKGQWRSVEIEKLTDQELIDWSLGLTQAQAKAWLLSMVRWIGQNVKEKEPINLGCESVDTYSGRVVLRREDKNL